MALNNLSGYHEWASRETPSPEALRLVLDFIVAAGEAPWLAPSVPVPELSDEDSQVRTAGLDLADHRVIVYYRETYAPLGVGVVDVFAVMRDPEQG